MFDSYLINEASRLGLPGMAVAITHRGQEIFAAGYGQCDAAGNLPVTPNTPFGIASITKFLTAMEILKLQEQGHLSLSDPVSLYYPNLAIASDARLQLHHLLSHSSGLPGLPCRFAAMDLLNPGDATESTEPHKSKATRAVREHDACLQNATELCEYMNTLDISLLAPPGVLLNYSNEGFCLLGGVIEKLTGETYQQRIASSLFKPLNMTHSVVGRAAYCNDAMATPLARNKVGLHETRIWDAPLFYPAGGVLSSARDLMRLFSTLSNNSQFLTDDSRRLLRQPVMSVASRPASSVGYSLGLEYQLIDNQCALHWHTGQRVGISSFVAYASQEDLIVSVLVNIADAPVAGIGFALMALILDRDDIVWPQRCIEFGSQSNSNSITESDTESNTSICSDSDNFQGRYRTLEGFDFQVNLADATWHLISDNQNTPLIFQFIDKYSGIVGQYTFRFLIDKKPSTKPWALALDLRILPRVTDT